MTPRVALAAAFSLSLIALLALTWWAYHPGLSGDFLFDDFGNLPVIGATGPVDDWATFWRYITSGHADSTGRPLALLTFLIDARNWPATPYPFKVTNLILHLINGALLAWVLWKLGRVLALPQSRHVDSDPVGAAEAATGSGLPALLRLGGGANTWLPALAALFGAGAWLLHPLFVSTTLYVVQREAMLPTTFVLIGMLGWIAAHDALANGHIKRGLIGMLFAAWGCTLLAVLSKANGALLPLLLLLVEWIALAPHRPMPTPDLERWRKRAVIVLLVLPTLLLLTWLIVKIPSMASGAAGVRDWTLGQRMLTEPRVLSDYLRLLFVPHAHSSGLFNDAFPVSRGLFQPRATLPCIVLILVLIGAGFALRKRHPAIALALLFYFAGQLLESTWIPLELYYEHRNYLPAMLLFWPIGIGLCKPGMLRWARGAVAAGLLLALAVLTWQRASLWGDGFRQAQVWAAINPDSARAQANAAQYDMAHGRPRVAAARLRLALSAHPHDLQIPVNLVGAECRLHDLRPDSLDALRRALATSWVGGTLGFNWFNQAIDMAKRGECSGLDFTVVQSLLDAARGNPHWRKVPGRMQDVAHLQGMLDLAEGNPGKTLQAFNRALAVQPRPGSALEQAAILGSSGYPRLGLKHLDYWRTLPPPSKPGFGMQRIHAWVLARQRYWQHETAHLRMTLEADAAAKSKDAMHSMQKVSSGSAWTMLRAVADALQQRRNRDVFVKTFPVEAARADTVCRALFWRSLQQTREPGKRYPQDAAIRKLDPHAVAIETHRLCLNRSSHATPLQCVPCCAQPI